MTRSRLLGLLVLMAVPVIVATFLLGIGRESVLTSVGGNSGGFSGTAVWVVAQFGFLVAGALIASRHPSNSVGWLFLATGVIGITSSFANEYALHSFTESKLPADDFAAWLSAVSSFVITPLFALLLLRFPTGRALSSRWRWNEWLIALAFALGVGAGLAFWPYRGPEILQVDIDEMAGTGIAVLLASGVFTVSTVASVVSLVSLVVRYRRAGAEERQQLKWFAYASAIALVSILVGPVLQLTGEGNENLVTAAGGLLLPAAAGVAILKYRLYDIDVVINKTIVFGVLAAFITAVYVAIVVGAGGLLGSRDEPNLALSILATAIVAIAFSPVKERTHRLANRLVYGHRLSGYEVLSQLSRTVATAPAPAAVLEAVADAAALSVNASSAKVTLHLDDERDVEAVAPRQHQSGLGTPTETLDVVHEDEDLGAISIYKGFADPLTPQDRKLLADLSSQAGLALHNARLALELQAHLDEIEVQAEELRSSRTRIVSAADDSRRRLERDITQGPRTDLVDLTARLDDVQALVNRDPQEAASVLESITEDANKTLDALRELARGIYPPLLADKGVVAALEAHIAKHGLSVMLESDAITRESRFTESGETTTYFCCVEILQTMEPGRARRVVSITSSRDQLTVAISGVELPQEAKILVADRVESLGGSLVIEASVTQFHLPCESLERVS